MSEEQLTDQSVPVETTEEIEVSPISEEIVEEVKERVFTQKELDAIVSKEKARERRKAERELQQRSQTDIPSSDGFESVKDYENAIRAEREKERLESNFQKFKEKEDEAIEKYDDYEEVVYSNLQVTAAMQDAILKSPVGPDVAYYLAKNPKEAARITRLSDPMDQIAEIVRLENRQHFNNKISSAPEPIKPVKAKGSVSYDVSDPRSLENMSTSEWIQKRREEMYRK